MSKSLDRIAPSNLRAEELEGLLRVLADQPALIGREGFRLDLPDAIFHLLLHTAHAMRRGQTVLLMPQDEPFTTQAAANYLGVSRPHLIELLDQKEISFYFVGSHRRILLLDLQAYARKRDAARRESLDSLFDHIDKAGLYEAGLDDCEESNG